MEDQDLRYDVMVEEALRDVVRSALDHAAHHGLPGEHHFYITFRTDADDVELPGWLLARYPEEITIVMQHQFDDLIVESDRFSVTLAFGGNPARMVVPFARVTSFVDPSVQFALRFGPAAMEALSPVEQGALATALGDGPPDAENAPGAGPVAGDDDTDGDGNVVTLDTFRRK